jgi:phospholipid/cholesterol/gamma-HCH transport system permease protein
MGGSWLEVPRDWLTSFGELARFCGRTMGMVFSLRVFRFFGEALRQAGILILSSTVVIWGLVFIIGLQCGIEGAYATRAVGAPAYAGQFSAWCDLRELIPYAFGYMMAAKVGTGIVAELGAMRISDEIDALEVMGIDSMLFLSADAAAGRLDGPALHVPLGDRRRVLRELPGGGAADRRGLPGRVLLHLLDVPEPGRPLYSVIKGMVMATAIVLVGCYYGYNAGGGPVGVGTATAKSMVLNLVLVHLIGMLGTQLFWGANPRAPVGG